MTADEAATELQRLLGGEPGIVSVHADNGVVVLNAKRQQAGRDVSQRYGGTYEGWPISVRKAESAGILEVEARIGHE